MYLHNGLVDRISKVSKSNFEARKFRNFEVLFKWGYRISTITAVNFGHLVKDFRNWDWDYSRFIMKINDDLEDGTNLYVKKCSRVVRNPRRKIKYER